MRVAIALVQVGAIAATLQLFLTPVSLPGCDWMSASAVEPYVKFQALYA